MKLTKKLSTFFLVQFIVSLALTAIAHDAWVEPGKGPLFHILYGHKIPESYPITKVISVSAWTINRQSLPYKLTAVKDGADVKVNGSPALFLLNFDNGYWLKDSTGESHNVPQSTIPLNADPLHAVKFSKTILSWQPWMLKPQGQRIEFVPVEITSIPKAGSKLKLQLLLDGKPLAGQMVENNSSEEGPKTDADGYVTVDVLAGENRYATDYFTTQTGVGNFKRLGLTPAFVFVAK